MNIESQSQRAVIQWWALACRGFGLPEKVLIHLKNQGAVGGRRGLIQGKINKGLGLRAGAPDLLCCVPRGEFHGLWIEMKKAKGGRLSADQIEMHLILRQQGYAVVVAAGFDPAMRAVEQYLRGEQATG